MRHRPFIARRAGLLAALISFASFVGAAAQEPFPQIPPNYYPGPGGQQNGYGPPGNPAGNFGPRYATPAEPATVTRSASWPGAPDASPRDGAVPASYQAQAAPPGALAPPGAAPPATPGNLCEGTQVLARVGDDVVLTGDVLLGVDDFIQKIGGQIPPDKLPEEKAKFIAEVQAAIKEYSALVDAHDPDPAKSMPMQHAMILFQLVHQEMEIKLLYQHFLKNIPNKNDVLPHVLEKVDTHFDEAGVKILMKREKVQTPADLETALHAKGSSLARERRRFEEQFIGQTWMHDKIKPDEDGKTEEEVTHEEMIAWYQEHVKQFEHQPRARWEELMISFDRHPDHNQARNALAQLGNQVVFGAPFGEVAKASSEGPTAKQGGVWDWTHKDSLDMQEVNDAIFSLPVGTLSPIIESKDGYRIIRVKERQEFYVTSFADTQKEIKEKIKKERIEKRVKEFITEVQKQIPTWTVFDSLTKPPKEAEEEDRYSKR